MHVQDEIVANTGDLRVEDMKQACKALSLKVSGELVALVGASADVQSLSVLSFCSCCMWLKASCDGAMAQQAGLDDVHHGMQDHVAAACMLQACRAKLS